MKITDIDRRIADLVAINPRPHQPSALVSMGRELLARDVEAATKCFDKALSIDPRHVPAWIARSIAQREKKQDGKPHADESEERERIAPRVPLRQPATQAAQRASHHHAAEQDA